MQATFFTASRPSVCLQRPRSDFGQKVIIYKFNTILTTVSQLNGILNQNLSCVFQGAAEKIRRKRENVLTERCSQEMGLT